MFDNWEVSGPPVASAKDDFSSLEEEVVGMASHIAAATARWLEHVALLDSARVDFGEGQTSAHWLAWRCSLSLAAAREFVRVAHALRGLPKIAATFRSGALSYHKVAALTKIATPEMEDTLLMWAATGTAAQIGRIVNSYLQAASAAELQAVNVRHDERYLDHYFNAHGSFVIKGLLDPEEGAVVAKALESIVDAQSNEDDSFEQRRADALVAMAETALDADASSASRTDRYQVVLQIDADALARGDAEGRAEIYPDLPIHQETALRLSCDCSVIPLIEQGGKPLDVGRKTRRIPTGTRRAMRARDRGCRWPGCTNQRWLDGHHIVHWIRGGETNLVNLVSLCRKHHRKVHEGGFEVRRRPDGEFEFVGPGSWIVEGSPPIGPPADLDGRFNTSSLPATYVDPCDYEVAVAALLSGDP